MLMRVIAVAMASFALVGAGSADASQGGRPCGLSPVEVLGKRIFFDQKLSINENLACAACHAPQVGWTGPDSAVNATGSVYEGSVPGRFGNRKPPASAYAGGSPVLSFDPAAGAWVGGMFWDGRATGWTLGDPLAEQALGPFLNPLEHALPDAASVVQRVCSQYRGLFAAAFGPQACSANVMTVYNDIGFAIAAYERSAEVSAFTSKYDAFLAGTATPSEQEAWGRQVFEGKGHCAACHPNGRGPGGSAPVFTDFTYDNLGVPRNPMNPFYYEPMWNPAGLDWVDEGLGGFLKSAGYPYADEIGKFKVPTLRNVDLRPEGLVMGRFVKAYGHNGYFKSLKEIVHFYNTRDVASAGWPAPEYAPTVNRAQIGNLGLTDAEEDAIVAFLQALSDGYTGACGR
jgi:cytochrome c peroxidase